MGMSTVMIVGGGYAGLMAANRASARGHRVTLVSDRDVFVHRIHLHEVLAGSRAPESVTLPLGQALSRAELRVARATHVGEGSVTLDDGATLSADHVVLATGSGAGAGGWEWATTHREAIARLAAGSRVSVLGAGLTGVETASEIAEQRPDLRVTLVDPVPVGKGWSGKGRAHVLRVLDGLGVALSRTPVETDLEIDCTGFSHDSLGRDSGLPVTARGAVMVDEFLRVPGFDRVWACGDAAAVVEQPHVRMACASAEPMAAQLIDQLGRADRHEPLRPLSLGFAGQCVSLGRRDGLIQYVRRDDTPIGVIHTGRVAAALKRLVCRFALVAPLRWSRWYRELEGPRG